MSRGAVSPEKFTLSQHLKGKKINFLPDKMMKDNLKNMVLTRQKLDDPIR
ncbi:hypothetical protein RT41_GL001834 [Lactococcus fujiensis JCM 16395]|uniref:Uncharacterized protein n=1 Tax=Lactococcus fujiensis JCM 16395 TaxID=1291764 RepID=A0A2A5RJS6_9LACT|nr:hypothetical protein RT41_GL001834 [Lactococcus fujiensis JCM 16395]